MLRAGCEGSRARASSMTPAQPLPKLRAQWAKLARDGKSPKGKKATTAHVLVTRLDKNLTAPDRKALETAVPPAFLDLDGAFHLTAAKLAEAARGKDLDLQHYYFSRMLESCQTCHAKYATDKFPAFGGKTPVMHSH